MILVLRQLADMLWEYKAVHILTACVLLLNIARLVIKNGLPSLYTIQVIGFVLLVVVYVTIVLQLSLTDYTVLPYFKLVGSLLVIVLGMLDTNPEKTIRLATYFCIPLVGVNTVAALWGLGYQTWGDANTYSGVYFFKTDLALAATISLSLFLCADWLKPIYKFILSAMCLYLVIISNARAYYVISFFLLIVYHNRNRLVKNIRYTLPGSVLALLLMNVVSTLLPKLMGGELLALDLTLDGFYSAGNTQGRSEIWEAILSKFLNLDINEQLIGLGLDGDIVLSANTLDNELSGATAHNGYVYILVAMGWVGVVIFGWFVAYVLKLIVALLNRPDYSTDQLIPLALAFHTVIYLLSNMSSPNIIFQQESWFFMYLVGCGIYRYQYKKVYSVRAKTEVPAELKLVE